MSHQGTQRAGGGGGDKRAGSQDGAADRKTTSTQAATSNATTYVVIGVLVLVAVGATYYYTRRSAEEERRREEEEEERAEQSEEENEDEEEEEDLQDDVRKCSAECRAKGDPSGECVAACTDKKMELEEDIADAAADDEDDPLELDEDVSPANEQEEYERLTNLDEERRRAETWDSKDDDDDTAAAAQECRLRDLRAQKKGAPPSSVDACLSKSLERRWERELKRRQSGVALEDERVEELRSPDHGIAVSITELGIVVAHLATRNLANRPRLLALDTPFGRIPYPNAPPANPQRYRLVLGRDAVLNIVNTETNAAVMAYSVPVAEKRRSPKRLLLNNDGVLRAVAVSVTGEETLFDWRLRFVWPAPHLAALGGGAYIQVGGYYHLAPEPNGPNNRVEEGPETGKNYSTFLYRLDQLSPVRFEMRHIDSQAVVDQINPTLRGDKWSTSAHKISRELMNYFGVGAPIKLLPPGFSNGDILFCHTDKLTYFVQRGQKRLMEDPRLDLSAYGAKTKRSVECWDLDKIENGPPLPAVIPFGIANGSLYRCHPDRVYLIEQEHKRLYVHQLAPTKDVKVVACDVLDSIPNGPDV
jgi:ferredoxin